jgi:hypothetical protein
VKKSLKLKIPENITAVIKRIKNKPKISPKKEAK